VKGQGKQKLSKEKDTRGSMRGKKRRNVREGREWEETA
jgi:hypothetical protein